MYPPRRPKIRLINPGVNKGPPTGAIFFPGGTLLEGTIRRAGINKLTLGDSRAQGEGGDIFIHPRSGLCWVH